MQAHALICEVAIGVTTAHDSRATRGHAPAIASGCPVVKVTIPT